MASFYTSLLRIFIELIIRKNLNKLDETDFFNLIWTQTKNSLIVRFLISRSKNSFFLDVESHLYLILIKRLNKRSLNISHTLFCDEHTSNVIKEIAEEKTLNIVITIHTGFAFTTKLISDQNRNVVVVNKDQNIEKVFLFSGIIKRIGLLSASKNTLLDIMDLINDPVTIICCIDEHIVNHLEYNILNINLIKLSQRYDIPLYFYRNTIDTNANVSCSFVKANCNKNVVNITDEFIKFINQGRAIKREFSIKN